MRIESWAIAAVFVVMCGGSATVADQQQCRPSPLPANVRVPPDLEDAFLHIYERSEVFRAQCARIAAADQLRVQVRINFAIPSYCRAFTVVTRRSERIRAEVHLPPLADYAELVAHEFEHIIEQIEGLDMRRLARVKGSGVREVQRELYESDRAQEAGRLVASEAGRWAKVPAAD